MNIKWIFPILMIIALTSSCRHQPTVEHVVLISLDGSRPEFYMDTSWPAPNLQKLKSEGVYASKGAESVFPSHTYPSHTSIVTGAYPKNHGIYYNKPFGGRPGEWYWNEKDIKSKTLWDAVKKTNMTSAAVFWPVSVGAPVDYNFPVRRPEKGEKGNLLTIKYPYITPKNLLTQIEDKTGVKFTPDDLKKKHFSESKTITALSNYIIKTFKPNLTAIHLVGIDHAEHAHGTDGPAVRRMIKVTDSLVGSILQTIKEAGIENSTTVIITGDHGHTNTKATFAPNVYLSQNGLISGDNWKAKFNASGGSAFLHIKDGADQSIVDTVVSILENTDEFRDGGFRILDRAELDEKGVNPNTPIAIAMKEGTNVSNRVKGKTLSEHSPPYRSTHGYDPVYPSMHTSFIAAGAGIQIDHDIEGIGIIDIAPLVARLLGLDFEGMDGRLIPGILSE